MRWPLRGVLMNTLVQLFFSSFSHSGLPFSRKAFVDRVAELEALLFFLTSVAAAAAAAFIA